MSDRARADNSQISKAIALWNCLDNLPAVPGCIRLLSHHPRYYFPLWFSHGVPNLKQTSNKT